MWYIFDKNGKCICNCNMKPNIADLASRKEIAVEGADNLPISRLSLVNGEIQVAEETTEEKLAVIRTQRNSLLAQSDWTDTLSAKGRLGDAKYAEWQTYRQALRDFPATCDVNNPVWPTKPL